jgi:hypothetical protein
MSIKVVPVWSVSANIHFLTCSLIGHLNLKYNVDVILELIEIEVTSYTQMRPTLIFSILIPPTPISHTLKFEKTS